MRKRFLVSILGSLVVSLFAAGFAFASISGSAHDFSGESWNPGGQICIVCHTPHNANSNSIPLWNHKLSTQTYTLYNSSTLNATLGQPSDSSKACLSCHDGTVALDAFGENAGSTFLSGSEVVGTDLGNDHPVSFLYDAALVTSDGGGLRDTATAVPVLGAGKTIDTGMLVNHKVECSSCHDVHAGKGNSGTTDNLLLVDNAGSALCLVCHNK